MQQRNRKRKRGTTITILGTQYFSKRETNHNFLESTIQIDSYRKIHCLCEQNKKSSVSVVHESQNKLVLLFARLCVKYTCENGAIKRQCSRDCFSVQSKCVRRTCFAFIYLVCVAQLQLTNLTERTIRVCELILSRVRVCVYNLV